MLKKIIRAVCIYTIFYVPDSFDIIRIKGEMNKKHMAKFFRFMFCHIITKIQP